MDLHVFSLVFSMPMWLTCSAFFCNDIGIIILLPFIVILPMTATLI